MGRAMQVRETSPLSSLFDCCSSWRCCRSCIRWLPAMSRWILFSFRCHEMLGSRCFGRSCCRSRNRWCWMHEHFWSWFFVWKNCRQIRFSLGAADDKRTETLRNLFLGCGLDSRRMGEKSRNMAIPVCLFLIKLVFVWHRRRSELAWTTELNFGHQKSLSGENFLHVQRNMLESFSCTFKMWRQRAVSFSHTFELFWMSKT